MDDIIIAITNKYTQIISREELTKYPKLNWGNGLGDRWAQKNIIIRQFIIINRKKYIPKRTKFLFRKKL